MPDRGEHIRKVTEIPNEALRYYVESSSQPEFPYLVDLSENEGNGACTCADFQARRWPAIRDGHDLFTRETSCVHIMAARRHWTIATLGEISRMVKQREQQPKRKK